MGRTIRGVQTFIRFVQGAGVVSCGIDGEWTGLFAGKPAPTGLVAEHKFCVQPKSLWERACSR